MLNKDIKAAVVPAAAQLVSCTEDLLAGASVGCLPQHPSGLFLMASTPSPRTVSELVYLEQAS
jgi:hypothetical protein